MDSQRKWGVRRVFERGCVAGGFPFYPDGMPVYLLLPTGGFSESPNFGKRGSSQGAGGS